MHTFHHPFSKAKKQHKFGVDIYLYGENNPSNNIVYEECETGHAKEFSNDVSTFSWFIIEGSGTFVVNDHPYQVGPKDLIIVPPKHRVYYYGKLKMVLSVTPAFDPQHEHHVRDVELPPQ